jgi:hypothetical protein
MSTHRKFFPLLTVFLLVSNFMYVSAQGDILWLQDYTSDMAIGNDTYRYSFATVDGNDCKVEFKESVTDRKGSTESRSWIFYLSDIDPEALHFNTRGKSVKVTLETRNSQKFISCYEKGELDEYTDEIELTMNEIDVTRNFIDDLREHIGSCRETETVWDDREAAFSWLVENIGEATDDDVQWEQHFAREERPYLATLISKSVNDKGEEESFAYLFDLSDINPASIKLEVSGRSLDVAVPVREGEKFIQVTAPDGKEYTDEMKIYADDIEVARQIVNALYFLVSATVPERPEWNSYSEALGFVKDQLGEVKIGDRLFQNSISFEDSPSGIVELTIRETDSDGETEESVYAFYLADMTDKPGLDVSRHEVTIEMETTDDRDYIMNTSGGSVSGYTSDVEFNASGIDVARDIINALETAIRNSEEDITEFASVDEVNSWMEENLVTLFREGEQYEQKLHVNAASQDQIVFERKLTEDNAEVTETKYLVYPEDISLEDLKIGVSMGRLNVALGTGKIDYIRNFENGELQNFTDEVRVYFSDPLVAKNFMAAIRFLKEDAGVMEMPGMSREEAFSFLAGNIPDVAIPGETHEQKLEMIEGDQCKLKFTRVEKEDDGNSDEYAYEFMAPDISGDNSKLSVNRNLIEINLVTSGNQKLIKPYENGEAENFDDGFTVYVDDVLLAKKLLAAFGALSEACK